MRILKYVLKITDRQEISIGSSIVIPLSAAEQNGKLMLWARAQENYFPEGYNGVLRVDIFGTGNHIAGPNAAHIHDFVGTVVMSNGLVWHVFASHEPVERK